MTASDTLVAAGAQSPQEPRAGASELEHFRAIVESSEDAVISKTLTGVVTSWNRGAQTLFGYSAQEMLGRPLLDLFPPDRQNEEAYILGKILAGEKVSHFETERVHRDGHSIAVSVCISPIRDGQGRVVGASKIARDISAQKAALQQQRLAASVFANTSEGIAITDRSARLVDVNQAFTRITGYDRAEVLGQGPHLFGAAQAGGDVFAAMRRAVLSRGEWKGEVWSQRKGGQSFVAWVTVSRISGDGGRTKNFVVLFSDVTVQKLQQEQLERGAHFDALTGLPNRLLLSDRLHRAMTVCQRSAQSLAVLYVDLDGFKQVNDRFGHEVGDELLVAVSSRMRLALREVDTLARMGGDEFVAVLADVEGLEACIQLANRVLAACSEPVWVQGHGLHVTASIGITLYPQDPAQAEQLVRHADLAMYQAKQAGKNRMHVFDAADQTQVGGRSVQQDRMAQALEQGELRLHFQPRVNMCSGAVLGAEALLRWQHPDKGLLLPGAFLPAVERHPLMEAVGRWVLQEALRQMQAWAAQGLALAVSLNLAARQLQQEGFARQLAQLLALYPDVPAQSLQLEVRETSALSDLAGTAATMRDCQRLGVQFAIDDFGTGQSSLNFLRHLPVQTLKIDQSFVRDMLTDASDLSIVKGVIGLAQAFDREVVAEGVETVAHVQRLLALGCEQAQGHAIARPMLASELRHWCASWKPPGAWSHNQQAS